jgi:hypothetical protein
MRRLSTPRAVLLTALLTALCAALCAPSAQAAERAQDLIRALPIRTDSPVSAPQIDGCLRGWDLSAAEPFRATADTADRWSGKIAMAWDRNALYLALRVSLPGRSLRNPNGPFGAYRRGDSATLALIADPAFAWPVDPSDPDLLRSDRVARIAMWRDTRNGADHLRIVYGLRMDQGSALDPAGARLAVRPERGGYVLEARIPWSLLHAQPVQGTEAVENGCPFRPGQRMTASLEVRWAEGAVARAYALYRRPPGPEAMSRPELWGQAEIAGAGEPAPNRAGGSVSGQPATAEQPKPDRAGAPIRIHLPAPGRLSVNILGRDGSVIRELMGGASRPAGTTTLIWDGRDQWGAPMPPGQYRWGAYLSHGIRAELIGRFGGSPVPAASEELEEAPPGGSPGPPIGAAADGDAEYLLWMTATKGCALLKRDAQGRMLWCTDPVPERRAVYTAVACGGRYVFVAEGISSPRLIRLDASTGEPAPFSIQEPSAPISATPAVEVDPGSMPTERQPETCGLACAGGEVYASVFGRDRIRVFDAASGSLRRELSCPGPRGLAADGQGDLYAVSYRDGRPGEVLRFRAGSGDGERVVTQNLSAPWGIAVEPTGAIWVSDEGGSQQLKRFDAAGKLLATVGAPRGRAWAGALDPNSLLLPAGLAANGAWLIAAEAAPPGIFRRLPADGSAGPPASPQLLFGPAGELGSPFPDPVDPQRVYYSAGTEGFARSTLPAAGAAGPGSQASSSESDPIPPDAAWDLLRGGFPDAGRLYAGGAAPIMQIGPGERTYLFGDANPHPIYLVDRDRIVPVGYARVENEPSPRIVLWQDANGDHAAQAGEISVLNRASGAPLPALAELTGSAFMDSNGDLYFATQANSIVRLPVKSVDAAGAIHWDLRRAGLLGSRILPRAGNSLPAGRRSGIVGMRTDSRGSLYACIDATVPYARRDATDAMLNGIGHTGEMNAVKIVRLRPDGRLLWIAGRKATGDPLGPDGDAPVASSGPDGGEPGGDAGARRPGAAPGFTYNFRTIAGLVGDEYVAAASDWGPIVFYTADGFYAGAVMDDPERRGAGDYAFGPDTPGARVQYYPDRDEVRAYEGDRAYRIVGFENGRVAGERRLYGSVQLTGSFAPLPGAWSEPSEPEPLRIVPLRDPILDPVNWRFAPVADISNGVKTVATVQLGYDSRRLYARVHVLEGALPAAGAAPPGLRAGVVLDFGPPGVRDAPAPGDVRFEICSGARGPELLAVKPYTGGKLRPGRVLHGPEGDLPVDFSGTSPHSTVGLFSDGRAGYVAEFAVPRDFLGFPISVDVPILANVRILSEGAGNGLERIDLFPPRHSEQEGGNRALMLHPSEWGVAEVFGSRISESQDRAK